MAKEKAKGFASLSRICDCFELKRDAYYKYKCRADKRKEIEQHIVAIVKRKRKSLPREGVRKLMKSLSQDFGKQQLKVGRDTLFNVLREHKMLIKKEVQCKNNQFASQVL